MNEERRPRHFGANEDTSLALIGFLVVGLSGALIGFAFGFLLGAVVR